MQPTTIKSKSKGCGTAPGNLVNIILFYNNNSNEELCFEKKVNLRQRDKQKLSYAYSQNKLDKLK